MCRTARASTPTTRNTTRWAWASNTWWHFDGIHATRGEQSLAREHPPPQGGRRGHVVSYLLRGHACVPRAVQAQPVLPAAVFAVGVGHRTGGIAGNQLELRGELQQGDVAAVGGELGTGMRVSEHEHLNDEFDVDPAPAVVLEVEQPALVRVALEELFAHRQHVTAQFRLVARHPQDRAPLLLEPGSNGRLARAESRARERLMLPGPGRFALVAAKGVDRTDEQPAPSFGAQAQVDVEENARGGAAGEPAGEALREARIDLRRPLVRILVEKDEIEVGRVAQFLAAELAVADDRETRLLAVAHAQLRPAQLQRHLEHDVGEIGQIVGQPLDREQSREILREEAEDLRVMRLAQPVHL